MSSPAAEDEDDGGDSSDGSSHESLLTLGGEAEEDTAAGSVDGAGKTARAISDDGPRRGNMDEFLSWAFFGTSHASASADPSKVRAL